MAGAAGGVGSLVSFTTILVSFTTIRSIRTCQAATRGEASLRPSVFELPLHARAASGAVSCVHAAVATRLFTAQAFSTLFFQPFLPLPLLSSRPWPFPALQTSMLI